MANQSLIGQRNSGALGTLQIADYWILEDPRSASQFDTPDEAELEPGRLLQTQFTKSAPELGPNHG